MFKINIHISYLVIISLILINIQFATASTNPAQETDSFIVITHKNTSEKRISVSKLQGIFSLKIKHWDDETLIKVYSTNPFEEEHHKFCKLNLGIFSHQLQRAWDRLTYSGRAASPIIVDSFDEMIKEVSKTPGAIGYIPREALNSSVYKLELIIGDANES